jgi:hypothetical protein
MIHVHIAYVVSEAVASVLASDIVDVGAAMTMTEHSHIAEADIVFLSEMPSESGTHEDIVADVLSFRV